MAFDDRRLRMIPAGSDEETSVAAERVLWIEPGESTPEQQAALADFREGRYSDSLGPLIESVQARPPVWRQQWLLMAAAQAAWRGGRPAVAMELVSQLDRRPLPPLVLAWLPVAWRSSRPAEAARAAVTEEARAAASEKLSDRSPAVRLVAASWLLASSDRQRALDVIDRLADSENRPRIAQLAEAVRVRAAMPDEALRSAAAWQHRLNALPPVMQVGPTIALSEKLRAAGDQRAATRLRWSLELTPPHPHPDLQRAAAATD